MSADNGGPAFPLVELDRFGYVCGQHFGLSVRDYFAAKVMQGEHAAMSDPVHGSYGVPLDASDQTLARLAQHYYRLADAMLKERAK